MNLPAMFETLMKLKGRGAPAPSASANFTVALLKTVVEEIKAPIACNQVEYHVMLDQTRCANISLRNHPAGGLLSAGAGQGGVRPDADGDRRKHGASAAQVALKWLLDQDGVAAIPRRRAPKARRPISARSMSGSTTRNQGDRGPAERQALREPGFRPA